MFKQRKHKTFTYKSRLSKENDELKDGDETKDFASRWRKAQTGDKRKLRGGMSMTFLILALVLLLICMYLIEKNYM
ncbi:hypothetical protein [Algibacter sp. 2305UL17-15]|uniref:hypothetical protein n=1 Tax=Algibacter sp. 2305UL17-15 TaxID=3231268 RepID=UPI003457C83E